MRNTNHNRLLRYFDKMTGRTDAPHLARRGSVSAEGDSLYHYGHFEVCRALRTRSGRLRGFLLNGDVWAGSGGWGPSTSAVQGDARAQAQREALANPSLVVVIVPFGALTSAGVLDRDFASIEVLHVTEDTWETIEEDQPQSPRRGDWYNSGGERLDFGYLLDGKPVGTYQHGATWGVVARRVLPDQWWHTVVDRVVLRDGTVISRDQRFPVRPTPEMLVGARYQWVWRRHWLGESLIRAKVTTPRWPDVPRVRWAHFVSGFDHNEPRPLYHLSELPGKQSRTVAEAYEELKPHTVRVAEDNGREVKRQGDIFAIPTAFETRSLTRSGGVREKAGRLLGTSHVATEVIRLPSGVTLARGTMRHEPVTPWGRRRADHVRLPLGKQWHIVVKNTVPVTAA